MADVGGKRKIRFGIGEWYARLFLGLSSKERLENAEAAQAGRLDLPCPPKHSCAKTNPKAVPGKLNCNKKGGVCSIREYEQKTDSSFVALGHLRVTCPIRFL